MTTKSNWTIEKMVTESRALHVARSLFPDDYSDGGDCRAEHGREGEPCRICAARNEAWQARVNEVRAAMIKAFS
jgi:hypothetical protein